MVIPHSPWKTFSLLFHTLNKLLALIKCEIKQKNKLKSPLYDELIK